MKVTWNKLAPPIACPCCGWETEALYFLGPIRKDSDGMCADCFAELIVDMEYEITEARA